MMTRFDTAPFGTVLFKPVLFNFSFSCFNFLLDDFSTTLKTKLGACRVKMGKKKKEEILYIYTKYRKSLKKKIEAKVTAGRERKRAACLMQLEFFVLFFFFFLIQDIIIISETHTKEKKKQNK
jgi:hypothetical protein